MSEHIKGSCACGAICYEVADKPKMVVNCHCKGCRQRNGAAFSTYCSIAQESFRIVCGEEHLGVFGVDDIGKKHFCRQCGTPLYNFNARYPQMYMLYYGAVSNHEAFAPRFNIYCESLAAWTKDIAQLKSFEQELFSRYGSKSKA